MTTLARIWKFAIVLDKKKLVMRAASKNDFQEQKELDPNTTRRPDSAPRRPIQDVKTAPPRLHP